MVKGFSQKKANGLKQHQALSSIINLVINITLSLYNIFGKIDNDSAKWNMEWNWVGGWELDVGILRSENCEKKQ